jgi:hypothetical protein
MSAKVNVVKELDLVMMQSVMKNNVHEQELYYIVLVDQQKVDVLAIGQLVVIMCVILPLVITA